MSYQTRFEVFYFLFFVSFLAISIQRHLNSLKVLFQKFVIRIAKKKKKIRNKFKVILSLYKFVTLYKVIKLIYELYFKRNVTLYKYIFTRCCPQFKRVLITELPIQCSFFYFLFIYFYYLQKKKFIKFYPRFFLRNLNQNNLHHRI